MAIEAKVKDVYDAYYDLCSGYTHGHWSAVRDAAFITCYNPLHRFHRVPRPVNFGMKSIVDDSVDLLNKMFDEMTKLYPDFAFRIKPAIDTQTKDAEEKDAAKECE